MLTADAAHLARLTCLTALKRSRPTGPYDEGDEDLKPLCSTQSVLIYSHFFSSAGGGPGPRRQSMMSGNSAFPTPPREPDVSSLAISQPR
jgi:hypothetical protein